MLQDVTAGDFLTMEGLVLVDGEIQDGLCTTAVDCARTAMCQNEAKGNRELADAGFICDEDNGFSMGIKAAANLEDNNFSQIMALIIKQMIINQKTTKELRTKTIMSTLVKQTDASATDVSTPVEHTNADDSVTGDNDTALSIVQTR